MARVLIVGGGSRALRLTADLIADGYAVRVVASDRENLAEIHSVGAEPWAGTPDRLATLRGALEHVTIACWLLADASGGDEHVGALHGSRLHQFIHSAIDTTLRGFVYESGGSSVPAEVLAEGKRIVLETAARNLLPVEVLAADPSDLNAWLEQAREAVYSLLEGHGRNTKARYAETNIPKSRSAFEGEAST